MRFLKNTASGEVLITVVSTSSTITITRLGFGNVPPPPPGFAAHPFKAKKKKKLFFPLNRVIIQSPIESERHLFFDGLLYSLIPVIQKGGDATKIIMITMTRKRQSIGIYRLVFCILPYDMAVFVALSQTNSTASSPSHKQSLSFPSRSSVSPDSTPVIQDKNK